MVGTDPVPEEPKSPKEPRPPADGVEFDVEALDPEYPDIEDVTLVDVEVDLPAARTCSLRRVRMTGGRLVITRDQPLDLCDVTLVAVDLAGVRIEGVTRAHLIRCRLTGADLAEATIRDVRFEDCAVDLAGARAARLERVVIADGRVDGLDLTAAEAEDLVIAGVAVRDVVLTGWRARRTDLTRADIAGVPDLTDLRGCTLSSTQAVTLALRSARALGIEVAGPAA